MPDWQGELEALLATLNVSLEGPPPNIELAETFCEEVDPGSVAQRNPVDDLETTLPASASDETKESLVDVVPVDGEEISAVRSEIEATLREVLVLVRAGRMNRALRDDVVFVLEALTRPRPVQREASPRPASPDDSSIEWNLASAAAVLRFCRIVLRLTNSLSRGEDV